MNIDEEDQETMPARHECRPADEDAFRGTNTDGRTGVAAALVGEHAPGFSGSADSSTSELMLQILQNFRGARFTETTVAELLDFLAELGFGGGSRSGAHAINDPRWKGEFVKILRRAFKHHPTPQMYALLVIWDESVLDDIVGHRNQVQFAESIGMTKAAVNNAVKDEQGYFGTKPRRDQRSFEACQKMSEKLISTLAPSGAAKGKPVRK